MTAPVWTAGDWIAVEWGRTHLRAAVMGAAGAVREAAVTLPVVHPAGDGIAAMLRPLIDPWRGAWGGARIGVLVCGGPEGGDGARRVPCAPVDPAQLLMVAAGDPQLDLRRVPGLIQGTPPDLIWGAETRIAGVLAVLPGFDGVVCLPGALGVWAHVSAREVVSFQTTMTGEMFALLLSALGQGDAPIGNGWDQAAFAGALAETMSRPERLALRLAGLRAEGRVAAASPDAVRARVSGLLIGAELAATRAYWLGRAVVVVGSPGLATVYAEALRAQGATPRILPRPACTMAGLAVARGALV